MNSLPPKTQAQLDKLMGALSDALAAGAEPNQALSDATKALKRAKARAENLSGEMERVEFVPSRGPTVEFTGRLAMETGWNPKGSDTAHMRLEIWETRAGALVAVSIATDRYANEDCRLTVVEPQEDRQAMHFAVMDHFAWVSGARNMARKLGWSLRVEIE